MEYKDKAIKLVMGSVICGYSLFASTLTDISSLVDMKKENVEYLKLKNVNLKENNHSTLSNWKLGKINFKAYKTNYALENILVIYQIAVR